MTMLISVALSLLQRDWLHTCMCGLMGVWRMVLICFGRDDLSGLGFLLTASILEKKNAFFRPNPATEH